MGKRGGFRVSHRAVILTLMPTDDSRDEGGAEVALAAEEEAHLETTE